MEIYISSDRGNDFFLTAVQESREAVAAHLTAKSIELIYPPMGWGGDRGDKGKILTNVLQILEADLILFDITPRLHGEPPNQITKYNEGVLIEYGIVLCLDNPGQGSSPWGGRVPKPSYRIFCSTSFPRGELTPIINVESVTAYGNDAESRTALIAQLREIMVQKVEEKLTVEYRPAVYHPLG